MSSPQQSRPAGPLRAAELVTIVAMSLLAVPAGQAAPVSRQEVLSVQSLGRHPDTFYAMVTRLTVPPQSTWATDPDDGPLTLRVETGMLGVRLGGGSARLERYANPLLEASRGEVQITPLTPGQVTVLRPGDRLVIVRGFQLTVTNDTEGPATAIVSRMQHASDLVRRPSRARLPRNVPASRSLWAAPPMAARPISDILRGDRV